MNGIEMITEKRERQLTVHGWTPEHDDEHKDGQLGIAALAYIFEAGRQLDGEESPTPPPAWPWSSHWWRPGKTAQETLAKAGALLAAEIDRINRKG